MWRDWNPNPLQVGSLRLHTLSPPMLPLPKTLLEGFFWNGVHLRRRVLHYLFSTLKTGSFQCRLQFRKQPEVARSHVWRVGRLLKDWNSMFRQEILDQVRWMCWSIVMMQLPVFRRPEVWSFAPNCITESAENLLIVLFCHCLSYRCVFVMHNSTDIKEHGKIQGRILFRQPS